MKLLTTEHKNITYEFRLLEASKLIQITKGDVFVYTIRFSRGPHPFLCSCPGFKYHGRCWHLDVVGELMQAPRVNEPWAVWAEEAACYQR
jgi:hypothetical protein